MAEWVAVVDEGEEPINISTEDDGTMLLSSLAAQCPGVLGLKLRHEGNVRAVKMNENATILYPPNERDGWGCITYICSPFGRTKEKCTMKAIDCDERLSRKPNNDATYTNKERALVPWQPNPNTFSADDRCPVCFQPGKTADIVSKIN